MSAASLIHNKTLSPVTFFILLLDEPDLRDIITQSLGMTFYQFVSKFSTIYPIVYKSRKITKYITKNNITLPIYTT